MTQISSPLLHTGAVENHSPPHPRKGHWLRRNCGVMVATGGLQERGKRHGMIREQAHLHRCSLHARCKHTWSTDGSRWSGMQTNAALPTTRSTLNHFQFFRFNEHEMLNVTVIDVWDRFISAAGPFAAGFMLININSERARSVFASQYVYVCVCVYAWNGHID